jgi:uncharacterized protein (AIM24 family)
MTFMTEGIEMDARMLGDLLLRLPLQGHSILCQRDSFLCATGSIDADIAFTKRLGAGFFDFGGTLGAIGDLIGGDRYRCCS